MIAIYSAAEIVTTGGHASAARMATIPDGDGVAVSPDGRWALVFDGFGAPSGPAPILVELQTGTRTTLAQPPASDGWFAFAGCRTDAS